MALTNRKINVYANPVSSLPDHPSQAGMTAAQLKSAFDANATGEIKTSINGIVDDLTSTLDNASGADNIGATAIKTGGATTVQGQLEQIQADKIGLAGTETITGYKTFEIAPIVPAPIASMNPATKKYVDDIINATAGIGDATRLGGELPEYYATAEQINNLATNLTTIETATLVEGYFTSRNIPTTAKRGLLDVKLYGNTAVNLVKNGNFASGTTGWTGNGATLSAINNTLSITGNGTSSLVSGTQLLNMHGNKRMYRMRARVTNSSCTRIEIRNSNGTLITTVNSPVINTWYSLTVVGTPNDETLLLSHRYADATTANGKVMEVQEVMCLDMGSDTSNPDYNLTADQMNTKYPVWFDGLQGSSNVEVLSVGKNLFDKDKVRYGFYNTTTGVWISDSATYSTQPIRCKPTTNYIISGYLGAIRVLYFDSVYNLISTTTTFSSGYQNTPNNASYIAYQGSYANFPIDDIQIEEDRGQTVGIYEPYKPTSVLYKTLDGKPVTLHRLPNGTRDEIDENGRKVERNLEYELKASDITILSTAFINYDYIPIQKTVFIGSSVWSNEIEGKVIVKGFNFETFNDGLDLSSKVGSFVTGVSTLYLIVPKGSYSTLAQAQTALAGTKIVYQKATPEIRDTNATPLIAEPNGTVFISAESSPLPASEMRYTNNVGAVIDGLIEGQKELSEIAIRQNVINLEFDLRLTTLEP